MLLDLDLNTSENLSMSKPNDENTNAISITVYGHSIKERTTGAYISYRMITLVKSLIETVTMQASSVRMSKLKLDTNNGYDINNRKS